MNDTREHGDNEMENPPAPPYKTSPAHSPDYYTPTVQLAIELVIPAMDEDHDNACQNEEAEVLRAADDDNSSERYWRAIDSLD
jgi:hypothetical protein